MPFRGLEGYNDGLLIVLFIGEDGMCDLKHLSSCGVVLSKPELIAIQ